MNNTNNTHKMDDVMENNNDDKTPFNVLRPDGLSLASAIADFEIILSRKQNGVAKCRTNITTGQKNRSERRVSFAPYIPRLNPLSLMYEDFNFALDSKFEPAIEISQAPPDASEYTPAA